MKATVLTDNIACGALEGEWGLSVYIETEAAKILLDAGATGLFLQNAAALGVEIGAVDFAVLSHAHYDHADGFADFFSANDHAPLYLRKACAEDCWNVDEPVHYIGIRPGLLAERADRLHYVEGVCRPASGVWLLPHTTQGLERIGKRESMMRICGDERRYDDFAHEQSLVIDTEAGLVIFNSCSHGGADNIIRETREMFPERPIAAIVGGFHLFNKTDEEVRAFAERVKATGISKLYTGHCTGDAAYEILKEGLEGRLEKLHVGLEMAF